MTFNLKSSVACLLWILGFGPLMYCLFWPLDGIGFDNKAEIVACASTFPILLLLALNPRFAQACARDPNRSRETRMAAGWLAGFAFVFGVVTALGEFVF